jgi:LPXTG-motif cell wall-anchored protein
MELTQSFDVQAPIDRVWTALVDVAQVAPCLPGASIAGRADDGSYEGSFSVKIGPTSAAYAGKLEMTEVDERARVATMRANGTDKRGQGGASATIVSRLSEPSPGVTRVEVQTDYRITGRLARFGRGGMIEDISEKLLRQFAANLQASLVGSGGDAPPAAGDTHAAPTEEEPGAEPAPSTPPPGAAPEAPAPEPTSSTPTPPATPLSTPPPPPLSTPPPPSEPLDAGKLVGGVLLDRVRQNSLPIIGALLLLLLLLLLRRRRR